LDQVVAVSATDIWALGTYSTSDDIRPLALHWDGAGWALVPAPKGSIGANVFHGGAAVASDDVWAVGSREYLGLNYQPLIEHWDGSTWTVADVPFPPGDENLLFGAMAWAADDVWAVGFYAEFQAHALVFHWDGTAWTQIRLPTGREGTELFGVDASSPSDVWAVGFGFHSDLVTSPFAIHFDGNRWSLDSPFVSDQSVLNAVDVLSSSDLWAVGTYVSTEQNDIVPLALHHTDC
jgi:hypothetical protein